MGRQPQAPQPYSKVYSFSQDDHPVALDRTQHVKNQVWSKENTLIWGSDDNFPLRLLDAVNKSPVTTSCLGIVEQFIMGSKFSEESLMDIPIDSQGTTLWEFHVELCKYLSVLDGFASRFTFNSNGNITNAYVMALESTRFVAPAKNASTKITQIKYNPYFGTSEYTDQFTKKYWLWDPKELQRQLIGEGNNFGGQVYYYGSVRPPFKFYPRPKYWSAEKWIYVDQAIQTFHKANTDNGFFLSSIMTMIGDPNAISKNPKYFSEVTGDDGVKRRENVKKVTVGEELDESLSQMFSGTRKAGRTFVQWVKNLDQAPKIEQFPANVNFDVFSGTFIDTIRGITIGTEVPAILANLPQQASSLGSDGNSMQKAVELMQSRVAGRQRILENFYNNILLPNFHQDPGKRVKIVNYTPINMPAEVPDKIWEWLNDAERAEFVKKNYPQIKIMRVDQPLNGQLMPDRESAQPQVNEALKSLNKRQILRLRSISDDVEKGRLTYDQAKQILMGYGLDEEQIKTWLTEEVEV